MHCLTWTTLLYVFMGVLGSFHLKENCKELTKPMKLFMATFLLHVMVVGVLLFLSLRSNRDSDLI